MQCAKTLSITVDEPAPTCSGLAADAPWEYDPNHASGVQPPVGLTITENFAGEYGTFHASKPANGTLLQFPVAQWRTSWNSGGGTLTVRATLIGTMDRTGTAISLTVRCRADADGVVVTTSQFCAAGVVTQVSLESIAVKPGIAGPTIADINHDFASQGIYDLSGEVFLSCT